MPTTKSNDLSLILNDIHIGKREPSLPSYQVISTHVLWHSKYNHKINELKLNIFERCPKLLDNW